MSSKEEPSAKGADVAAKKQTKSHSEARTPDQEPITLDRETVDRLLLRGERVHEWFVTGQKSLRCIDDVELRFRYQ
jgi:hypothetical protein